MTDASERQRSGSVRVERPAEPRAEPGEAELVSPGLRIAAAWAWRFVAVLLALIPIGWLIAEAAILVVPLLVAALLASLLSPLVRFLQQRWRFPKGLAILAALLALAAALTVLVLLVVTNFRGGIHIDWNRLIRQYDDLLLWLHEGPLHITEDQLAEATRQLTEWFQNNVSSLVSGALSAGSTVFSLVTGTLVTLFVLVFYLLDGRRIWLFIVSLFPRAARAAIDGAGRRGWVSIGHYVRVQIIVALIDAVGIFLGAFVLQVPFAVPIGIIVFLASFVPFIGAVLSGSLAVLIALIYNGLWPAVIMLIIVVAVMQVEAHVLQPLIMGSAVKVHPLGVLLSVSAGSLFAGIAGAVFAVPLVASAKVIVQYIASGAWRGEPDPTKKAPPPPRKRFDRSASVDPEVLS